MNKKGFQLAVNTVVIMILALAVLLFLVLFFTGSAGDFLGKIRGYSGYSNVDNIVNGCNILADTNAQYEYCCERKIVKYFEDGSREEGEFSCRELKVESFGGNVNSLNCNEVVC